MALIMSVDTPHLLLQLFGVCCLFSIFQYCEVVLNNLDEQY
jgi:hypothetical protein